MSKSILTGKASILSIDHVYNGEIIFPRIEQTMIVGNNGVAYHKLHAPPQKLKDPYIDSMYQFSKTFLDGKEITISQEVEIVELSSGVHILEHKYNSSKKRKLRK